MLILPFLTKTVILIKTPHLFTCMTPRTGMPRAASQYERLGEPHGTQQTSWNGRKFSLQACLTATSSASLHCKYTEGRLYIGRLPSIVRDRRQRSGIGGILKALCSKKDIEAPRRADMSSFHASFIAATCGYGVEGPHSTLSRRSQARRQSRLEKPW